MYLPKVSFTSAGAAYVKVADPVPNGDGFITVQNLGAGSGDLVVSFDGVSDAFTVPAGRTYTTAREVPLDKGLWVKRAAAVDVTGAEINVLL